MAKSNSKPGVKKTPAPVQVKVVAKKVQSTLVHSQDMITIRGARTHNLKDISLQIPRNQMTVITGLSGSGKSSLAFDTIFAEGQRRYIESLSSYARQFLRQMQKPDVDEISGLSPAISIDQKSRSNNPRSTVATITEIYDYLRILYARVGKPHCLVCDREIKKLSKEEIIDTIHRVVKGIDAKAHVNINDVEASEKKTKKKKEILGVEIDHETFKIYAPLVIGRKGEYYQMLYDLLGKGYEEVRVDGKDHKLRERITLDKNKKHDIDVLVDTFYISEIEAPSQSFTERLNESIERGLGESEGLLRINANGEEHLISSKFMCPYDGFSFPEIEPRLFSFNSPYGACPECNGLGTDSFFTARICKVCNGARLRPEALRVLLTDGNKNVVEFTKMTIQEAVDYMLGLKLSPIDQEISQVITKEILARLEFLQEVGLDYLGLDRRANTLSGGEAQRIRLASQLGSGLVGAMYVLDEPTIGLHQRDNDRLIKTLVQLKDMGNTVIIVEHDEDTILASDYLVDIGPGAGVRGGNVVVAGELKKLLKDPIKSLPVDRTVADPDSFTGSLTLDYLRGEHEVEVPKTRRNTDKGMIKIAGGQVNNIKNLNVEIPLGKLVTVTGVSGSGKSSFVYEILYKNLLGRLDRDHRTAQIYNCATFTGTEYLGRTILIDQSPIGRTPRSNPATYTGAFTHIRDLFAETIEAKSRGWGPGRFSFNVKGGRCETCQGNGAIEVEMHFLPTVYVTCDVCHGKRFMKETLEVTYKKKNIYEILKMTVEEAVMFFEEMPGIYDRVRTLQEVGLGYLELGQSATTLSGGEAQRVKIASELYKPHVQKTIYILDEPTVGLHYHDVRKLIEILQKLVDQGNSVVVIEHNMDLIKCSDWLIDIGPEGGDRGGQLVAKGTPEQVADHPKSYTGVYLKRVL
ncbi:MAG: excinuclease ABC subunit UvrA [Patescibacteria group bacterium]